MSVAVAALWMVFHGFVATCFLYRFPRASEMPSIVRAAVLLPLAGAGLTVWRGSSVDDAIVVVVLAGVVIAFAAMTPDPADR